MYKCHGWSVEDATKRSVKYGVWAGDDDRLRTTTSALRTTSHHLPPKNVRFSKDLLFPPFPLTSSTPPHHGELGGPNIETLLLQLQTAR